MGCVHSTEIIKLNDNNHDSKTDNNKKNNISNSMNNSSIKEIYKIQNKKSANEEILITNKNSNKIISNINVENNSESREIKAEIIQAPPEESSIIKSIHIYNFNLPEILNNYEIIEEISKNQMSIDFKIRLKKDKKIFKNLKVIFKSYFNDDYDENKVLSQIKVLKTLKHDNIIQIEQYLFDENNFYLISEFCEFGTLEKYIEKNKIFTENQTKYIINQILKTIEYLNSKNYVHTDIKPENILIEKIIKKKDEELCEIKLLNFGSSYSLNNNPSNNIPINNLPYYVSPEIINRKYNTKCDIWSIGIIMYEMLFGKKLFNGNNYNEVINNIKNQKIEFNISNNLSNESIDLLKKMIVRNIINRFDVKKCLEHSWFISLKEFDDLDEDINTNSNKKNSYDNNYKNYDKINEKSFNSSEIEDGTNVILINNNNDDENSENNISYEKKKKILKSQINYKCKFNDAISDRSDRTYDLRNKEIDNNNQFINLTIKYIHHFYIKQFQKEKEEKYLKQLFDNHQINNKINFKEIILCFNQYYGYEKTLINCISTNELIEKKLIKNYSGDLNLEEFINFLLKEKENNIINNLKKIYQELEKTNREEIKMYFKEINKRPFIQRYFKEMIIEMEKDKLKENYLFNDYITLIEKVVVKLNSKEEIEKFKLEEKKLEEEKIKKLEEIKKKKEEEKRKKLDEERKKKIEEENNRKKLENEKKKKIKKKKNKKKIEKKKKKKKKKNSNHFKNSFINDSLIQNDLQNNENAFNPEEFLKLVQK